MFYYRKSCRFPLIICLLLAVIAIALIIFGINVSTHDTGDVWAWGDNGYGQLGDDSNTDSNTPIKTDKSLITDNITSVSAGGAHSLALDENGDVWAWGWNVVGQLGDNSNTTRYTPVKTDKILMSDKIVAISAGFYHSLALDENGDIWAWGYNNKGQLGDGSNTTSYTPVKTDKSLMNDKIVSFSAGSLHSLALDENGDVWAWGDNYWGQLGDDTSTTRYTPVKTDESLMYDKIVAVSAGDNHSLALDENGDVWAWGDNNLGQLGDNSNTDSYTPVKTNKSLMSNKIVAISTGDYHNLALDENGDVWAWGYNFYGQLGDSSNTNSNTPVKTDKSLMSSKIVAVSAGRFHSLALDENRNVWAWGYNGLGQLGDNSNTTHYTPVKTDNSLMSDKIATVSAGYYHSLAIQQFNNHWLIWIIIIVLVVLLLYLIWRILHCNCC